MLNYNSPIKENKNYSDLTIKEIYPVMKLNIRGKKREFFTNVEKTLNMILPTEANTSATSDKLTSIWLSPDEWMIFSNDIIEKDDNNYELENLLFSNISKNNFGSITDDPNEVLEEGAQIVSGLNKKPVEMLGHVTSSYFSPNLNKSIALAVVRSGKNMLGKKLFIPMKNKTINVTIENPVFFDKENKRLNA